MPNCNPRNGWFYAILTPIIYYFDIAPALDSFKENHVSYINKARKEISKVTYVWFIHNFFEQCIFFQFLVISYILERVCLIRWKVR